MKILFVSHSASRSGAPLLLLKFLRWLHENTTVQITVLLKEGGALSADFASFASVIPYYQINDHRLSTKQQRKIRRTIEKALSTERFEWVYSNTIANGDVLVWLAKLGHRAVITHIHELAYVHELLGADNWQEVRRFSQFFILSNEAMAEYWQSQGLARRKIFLNPVFSEIAHSKTDPALPVRREKDEFIVAAAGTLEWRKGADLFLQAAALFRRRFPDVRCRFIWVGGAGEQHEQVKFCYDRKMLALEDVAEVTGIVENPASILQYADVFMLLSREESFGLVGLEAALCERPIVCFQNGGGMPQFVGSESGFVLPYVDVPALVEKLHWLFMHPQERTQMGQNARRHAASYTAERHGRRFLEIIEQVERVRSGPVRFSVIVPTYNRLASLRLTLDGLANQTYTDFEVIICDNSQPAMNLVSAAYPFSLKVVHHKPRGRSAARNSAAKLARGEWLVFIDDHDYPKANLLQEYADAIAGTTDEKVQVFRGGVSFVADVGSVAAASADAQSPVVCDARFVTNNICIRREAFNAVGRFEEKFVLYGHEDTEFGIRYAKSGRSIVPVEAAVAINFPSGEEWWYFLDRHRQLAHTEFQIGRLHKEARGLFKGKKIAVWIFTSRKAIRSTIHEYFHLLQESSESSAARLDELRGRIQDYLYGLGVLEVFFPFKPKFDARTFFLKAIEYGGLNR